ncbi:MAG TPA: phosphoadenosine phosphosulfate reductase family protein [Pyrinomonadaceae bacterium]|nr:phosphoadenosine phosphosulfate reductase family protein [Pyrinomonadaceae bacterium]
MERSIALTAEALRAYRERYAHWAIGYSGGKDSSATVTLVAYLIETGQVSKPETLRILYADTGMELPTLNFSALSLIDSLRRRGFDAEVVKPILDQRFFVYMFGRGVPPPAPHFRWCTGTLKIEPMRRALEAHAVSLGFGEIVENEKGALVYRGFGDEKLLMLTGVRLGESAARDARIVLSCSKDSGECGQGYLQKSAKEGLNDVLAPLVHWRVCHVWDWLMLYQPEHGFETRLVAEVYGIDEEGSTAESDARTGCIQCNVAKKDTAFDNILKKPHWQYLRPLKRLRPLYAELREPRLRLRKFGERNVAGELVKNQGRLGPLTFEARQYGLSEVIKIQDEINEAARQQNRPTISLIDSEELNRIEELIAAKTFPDKWTGEEDRGDVRREKLFSDGTVQNILFGD